MSRLTVTMIDVGWGDSIFLESEDSNGKLSFALIDSNDTTEYRSSFIFLKKYFERKFGKLPTTKYLFDFVLLSHAHADHGQGLKAVMKQFGTHYFWYPKSLEWSAIKELISFANRSVNIEHHQSIDATKLLSKFGDVAMEILWPPYNQIDKKNENNNSIVLHLKLNGVSFFLTGDAEADVWAQIAQKIPPSTQFFKVPHHGSVNGTFDKQKKIAVAYSVPAENNVRNQRAQQTVRPSRQRGDRFTQ
jgi:L-ascorbate metabolism protein UlaG (beta-lactamase superfamily)